MSKFTTFSLTLLSAFVLSACSGGGGNGQHNTTQAQLPKVNHQQNAKVEETVQPKAEKQQPKMEEQAPPKANNAPPTGEQPRPKIEKEMPIGGTEVPPKTDEDIFNTFNPNGRNVNSGLNFVKLHLDGKEVQLSLLDSKQNLKHKLETLRDQNDKLVGYYGYAIVSGEKPRYHGDSSGSRIEYSQLSLLEIARHTPVVQPTQNMEYRGKMYYHYKDIQPQAKEGNVTALYTSADKRLAMKIISDDFSLELRKDAKNRFVDVPSETESRENVVGRLYDENNHQEMGHFTGGLYGDKGEILAGKAESRYEQGSKAWIGVVGATATSK